MLKLRLNTNSALRPLLLATLVVGPLLLPADARAQVSSTFSERAQGLNGDIPTVKVWPGFGVNISFIPTGETITKVWLDDPSKVTLDFDSPLCDRTGRGGGCQAGSGAMVIHLRQVRGIKFPNLPQAKSSLLTVVTHDLRGQRKLQTFRLVMASGKPEYSTFTIYPDSKGPPTLQVRDRIVPLTAVEQGMQQAHAKRLLTPDLQGKVLNFIALAQNGIPVTQAAQQAGVSMALVTKLAQMGQTRRILPASTGQPRRRLLPTNSGRR